MYSSESNLGMITILWKYGIKGKHVTKKEKKSEEFDINQDGFLLLAEM